MKLTVTGLDGVRKLQDIPRDVIPEVIRQMAAIAYDSADEGARAHTKPGGTGALLQSLYNRQGDDRISRAVGHDPERAPQALFVNFGTRPHVIRPKTKKALRWVGPNGAFAFARRVNHPGYVGDPYIVRAADQAVTEFRTIVDNAMKRSL